MKVLFLDIDGVLNSEQYLLKRGFKNAEEPWQDIDPTGIAIINHVVASTGCRVVLSSDWRKEPYKPGLIRTQDALLHQGATFVLADCTPILTDRERLELFKTQWQGNYTPRWMECQAWLLAHPEVKVFAAIDDAADFEPWSEFFVQADAETGITEQDGAKLINLLGQKLNWLSARLQNGKL